MGGEKPGSSWEMIHLLPVLWERSPSIERRGGGRKEEKDEGSPHRKIEGMVELYWLDSVL